ncbi:MAG: triphosphoribosyl-dephospho-CoA synthase, partial [Solirubrobacterales bacterium]|nr:triphosphoribosyl-dephospho-CoA synthase [Solirubrobacterales bacterium]
MDATLAHSSLSRDLLARDVQLACLLEVSALKPGNITPAHDFSDTTYADMVRSALALGAAFAHDRARHRRVGELIADGVSATARVTAANTNLGIVLLLAPLVRAEATRPADEPLRVATGRILAGLDVDDATAAFAAIVAAQPGGLGDAP